MKLIQTSITKQQKDNLLYNIFLGKMEFLKTNEKLMFLNEYPTLNDFLLLDLDQIQIKIHRNLKNVKDYQASRLVLQAEHILNFCIKKDIQILLFNSSEYPEILKQISDPPFLLYCIGDVSLLQKKGVSVVGTRKISQDAKELTMLFSKDACLNSCNVVSGLASGVDTYAHTGVVNTLYDYKEQEKDTSLLGKTIAVLPGSIDNIIPSINKKLAIKIIQTGGLIISEYSPYSQTQKWNFVARNRIIAALTQATVVMQAPCGSGALITADFALDYNRDVFIHEAAFLSSAKQISNIVYNRLKAENDAKPVSKYKMNNTVEKFIENGAQTINSYKDYVYALDNSININKKTIQRELF